MWADIRFWGLLSMGFGFMHESDYGHRYTFVHLRISILGYELCDLRLSKNNRKEG